MNQQIKNAVRKSNRTVVHLVLMGSLIATGSLSAADENATNESGHHAGHDYKVPAKLVETVRNATEQFVDVNAAVAANYHPAFGCVSGPDHGAMGVHYINGVLVGDGLVDATKPEALIYEPRSDGMHLVGVEFIVDAATWLKSHSAPPTLEGQAFQFVDSPNRFGIPAFFELHVWAWRDNPNGAFVDWNNRVSCDGQQ